MNKFLKVFAFGVGVLSLTVMGMEIAKPKKPIIMKEAYAEEIEADEETSIIVSGHAKESLSPNQVLVSAYIESESDDINTSREQNMTSYNNIVVLLGEKGIKQNDFTVDYITSQPRYSYDGNHTLLGYFSTTSFSFTINDIENINDYLQVLTENGISGITNVKYQVSNMEEEYNSLLSKAVENARSKAESILGQGVSIIKIREEGIHSASSLARTVFEKANFSFSGSIDLEANVIVEFSK